MSLPCRRSKGRHVNAGDVDQEFVIGVDEDAGIVDGFVVVVLCVREEMDY